MIAVVSSAILDINNTQFASVERIMRNFTTLGQNRSDQGRINLYIEAVDNFIDTEGSGVGTGGFSYYFGVTKYTYPHNLFLEVASEQGIIGLLILLILLGTVVIPVSYTHLDVYKRQSTRRIWRKPLPSSGKKGQWFSAG